MVRTPKWKESEKDLVAEQPGMGMSLIGCFLALFIGLSVRTMVAPEKVRTHLEKATSKIHKDIDIQFKKAYVSFANGILPDLSVIIEDIKIVTEKKCNFHPMAEINRIRLPLSWWHLFQGKIFIHEVLAEEVDLSLRETFQSCDQRLPAVAENNSLGAPENISGADSATLTTLAALTGAKAQTSFQSVRRKNPIDTVRVAALRVHYLPMAFTSFEIQKLKVVLKSEEPRWIEVGGHLNLGGETLTGDYSSHADLKIDAVEGDQPSLKVGLKGVWREGHYDIHAVADLKTEKFDLETNLRHLPLSQVIPLLRKYRLMESDFNGKKAWLSGDIKMKGSIREFNRTPISFEGMKLEGDLGEISCVQARVESLEPFQLKPLDVEIKKLNLKELLVFLNRPHPTPTLANLGTFSGTAHVLSQNDLKLRGDYSGLEFIFSNKGSRKIQTLSLVSGELALQNSRWKVSVDRVKPADGLFDGKIQISADRDFKEMDVTAKIDELSLSPDVQTLMTDGGSFGAMTGNLKARIVKAEVSELKGLLRWEQLLINGIHFNRPRVQISTQGSETVLDVAATEMDFATQKSLVGDLFAPILGDLAPADERMALKAPSGQIRTERLRRLKWSGFQAVIAGGTVRSQGGWSEKAELSGEIKVSGKKKSTWVVAGDRNSPVLRKKDP